MLPALATLHVYLVEPSSTQAKLITGMLAKQGVHDVTHFESAAAMLERCAERAPTLIICALYLPDMEGTEVVGRLRRNSQTEHTPFILISSETRPQLLEPVRQGGACAILPKPFSAHQLLTALRNTLEYLDDRELDLANVDIESLKVLVVDDSPSARGFVRRALSNLGIAHFIECANGREAIAVLNDTQVDLVVTDYNMPELDGRGLIEFIRKSSWQSSVPVLMVTSETEGSRLAAVEEAGVSGICDKPMEAGLLRALLARMLQPAS